MEGLKEQQDEIGEFLRNNNIDEGEYEKDVQEEFEKLQKDLENDLNLPEVPKNKINVQKENNENNNKKIVLEA